MIEPSSEVAKHIRQIGARLTKDQTLRELLGTKDPRPAAFAKKEGISASELGEETIFRQVHNEPTKIAKSEVTADEALKKELREKVDRVSRWLWENGRPPQGEELEATEESGKVSIDDRFYFTVDQPGEPRYGNTPVGPDKLYAEEDSPGNSIQIDFGHDERYGMEIDYYKDIGGGRKRRYAFYYSGVEPLDTIAENEALIANGVLDDFIEAHNIPNPQDPLEPLKPESMPSAPSSQPDQIESGGPVPTGGNRVEWTTPDGRTITVPFGKNAPHPITDDIIDKLGKMGDQSTQSNPPSEPPKAPNDEVK